MVVALPSFYFPPRDGDGYPISQSLLTTSDGRHYSISAVAIFFFLQIFGGQLGVPLILLTLYTGKGVKRHPMLVNFLVTWVIYSVSFCVLLYLGRQFGPEPDHELCAAQAALIYGTAVMTPTAGLSFILNLWFSLRAVTENRSTVTNQTVRNYLLIAAPYCVFVAFLIFTASVRVILYGAVNPVKLSRNQYLFYCTINSEAVDVVPATSGAIMFIVIVFEGKSFYFS